jgi:hypothetical protein
MKLFRNFITATSLSLTLVLLTGASYFKTVVGNQVNPIPFVNAPLVPDSVAPGGSDFKLTVNGTGFVTDSVVQWNGAPLATTLVNSSQLQAVVPAANIAKPETASVSVANPGPGGGTSGVALFSIRAPFGAASFGQTTLPSGSRPSWVAVADLNDDGALDVATSLFSDHAISVSLGNGDGTFQAPVVYPVGGPPVAVLCADFNNDGKVDLAVTRGTHMLSVLLGNGDGTFQPQKDFSLGELGATLAAGDFDSNGNLDLAVALGSGQVAVLLGNGDGTFQQAVTYKAGSDRAFGVITGDFNHDSKLDLAVTVSSDDAVSVLLGNGDGTFQAGLEYSVQAFPQSLAVADFNGDGALDLATQTAFGWVSVLLGKGDGTFLGHVDYEIKPGNYGIASADVNGDGKLDLVVPAFTTLSTFLGRGDGTFWKRSDFATDSGPVTIAVGDFDSDGRLDLLTANSDDNTLTLLPQVTSVLSRTYVKFGNVKVGDSANIKVALSNIGNTSFDITKIALEGTSKVAYSKTSNCGKKLAPGGSCKITIVFTPLSPIPYRKARIKVNTSAVPTGPQKIFLIGSGSK